MSDSTSIPGVPTLDATGVDPALVAEPERPEVPGETAGSEPPTSDPTESPEPTKAKRKRRTKAQVEQDRAAAQAEAQAAAQAATVEQRAHLAKALGLGFDAVGRILETARGPHWRLREEETAALGSAWADALAPYMGDMAAHAPMLAAVLVTVGVAAPRVMEDRKRLPGGEPGVTVEVLHKAPVEEAPAPSVPPADVTDAVAR